MCNVSWALSCTRLFIHESSRKNPLSGVRYKTPEFILVVLLGHGSLEYAVQYRSEWVGAIEAKYPEDY